MIVIFLLLAFFFLVLVISYFLLLAGFTIFDLTLPAFFVPTKKETVAKMMAIAQIKKGDKVFDLGSGDGRLVISAAKLGAVAIGVERNPFLVILSKFKIKLAKVKAEIFYADIFSEDLSSADTIFLYLNPKLLAKLALKLEKELKKGTKIVSNRYPIPNWKPEKNFDKIFLYFK